MAMMSLKTGFTTITFATIVFPMSKFTIGGQATSELRPSAINTNVVLIISSETVSN